MRNPKRTNRSSWADVGCSALLARVDAKTFEMWQELDAIQKLLERAHQGRCAWEIYNTKRAIDEAHIHIKKAQRANS